jgi:hypothetical protein
MRGQHFGFHEAPHQSKPIIVIESDEIECQGISKLRAVVHAARRLDHYLQVDVGAVAFG